MDLKEKIRVIHDFPQAGIRFKDITTLLKDGPAYQAAINQLVEYAKQKQADVIVGPEARGFVFGAPLAYALGIGFVPIRKSGKLPGNTIQAGYQLEYGKDALAVHEDAISKGERVLIVDDLLATGGTILATLDLIRQLGGNPVGTAFLIELTYLQGREKVADVDVFSIVKY
jgi:adenine phosphoribosyltransferase